MTTLQIITYGFLAFNLIAIFVLACQVGNLQDKVNRKGTLDDQLQDALSKFYLIQGACKWRFTANYEDNKITLTSDDD